MPPAPAPPRMDDEIIRTQLSDGTDIYVRTIRPTDEERMRKGIEQLSAHSRYLRFFSTQPVPSDVVIEKLVEADGHRHIAWGAMLASGSEHPAIGAVHVFRNSENGRTGEFAVAIVDAYHGLGLARILTAVLLVNCRLENIATLDVQILSENKAAVSLVRSLGGKRSRSQHSISDYVLETDPALATLRSHADNKGLQDVFAQLAHYL
jgi:RimJ/RimL family protein N-acetyltransferase